MNTYTVEINNINALPMLKSMAKAGLVTLKKNKEPKLKPLTASQQEVWDGIVAGLNDVKRHLAGEIQLQSLDEVLKEWEEEEKAEQAKIHINSLQEA
jgi:hypothetical protein